MRKLSTFVMVGMLLLVTTVAQATPSAQDLYAKVQATNPGLKDYSAAIKMEVDAKVSFIPYRPTLEGRYYHKRPDLHKLEVTKAPSYLKKYPNIFGFSLPSLKKYRPGVVKEERVDGKILYRIPLLPVRANSSVSSIDLFIEPSTNLVKKQFTYYKNGNSIKVWVNYAKVGQFQVFDSMRAEFEFPTASGHAKANARYSDYRFNQGLSDSFFEKKR